MPCDGLTPVFIDRKLFFCYIARSVIPTETLALPPKESDLDTLINSILTEIRADEAAKGKEYLGCDWTFGLLRREDVSRYVFMCVLLARLAESKKDARAFVHDTSHHIKNLTLDELIKGLEVATTTIPETFLMAADTIAAAFGRRLCPDLKVYSHGQHHDQFVAAGRAAMNDAVALAVPYITEITNCWSLVCVPELSMEIGVSIARKVTISPMGIAFITKVLLRLSPKHYAAAELLSRVKNAIAEAPMVPERNAAVLYRFAIMAGVELNVVGIPEWRDSNRVGTVPKAWFNAAFREAVQRNGWTFVQIGMKYVGRHDVTEMETVEINNDDGRVRYHHDAERWGDKLQQTDEVMVPTKPPQGLRRNGDNKYCDYTIGFHPVAAPTIEMIRGIK